MIQSARRPGRQIPGRFLLMKRKDQKPLPVVSPWFTEYLIQLLIILMEVLR